MDNGLKFFQVVAAIAISAQGKYNCKPEARLTYRCKLIVGLVSSFVSFFRTIQIFFVLIYLP